MFTSLSVGMDRLSSEGKCGVNQKVVFLLSSPIIKCGQCWFGLPWRTHEKDWECSIDIRIRIRIWSFTSWDQGSKGNPSPECYFLPLHQLAAKTTSFISTTQACSVRWRLWLKGYQEVWQGACSPPCSPSLSTAIDSTPGQHSHLVTHQISIIPYRSTVKKDISSEGQKNEYCAPLLWALPATTARSFKMHAIVLVS